MAINRRTLLLGGAGALATLWNADKIAIGIGGNIGLCNQPDSKLPNIPPSSQTQTSYAEIYGQTQFTLVGDSNHSDLRIQDYFFSDENIEMMAKAGIKNVCLERGFEGQPLFDALQNGEITPEDFVIEKYKTSSEEIESTLWLQSRLKSAYGIRKMAEKGIKVHCSDVRYSTIDPDPKALAFQEGAYDFHEDMCKTPNGITDKIVVAYILTNPINFIRSFNTSTDLNEARDNDNKAIATLIRNQCGDEPSVVFFGQGHFGNSASSISNALGEDLITEIVLFGSKAYDNHRLRHQADFVHYVEEGQIFEMDSGLVSTPVPLSASPSSP